MKYNVLDISSRNLCFELRLIWTRANDVMGDVGIKGGRLDKHIDTFFIGESPEIEGSRLPCRPPHVRRLPHSLVGTLFSRHQAKFDQLLTVELTDCDEGVNLAIETGNMVQIHLHHVDQTARE